MLPTSILVRPLRSPWKPLTVLTLILLSAFLLGSAKVGTPLSDKSVLPSMDANEIRLPQAYAHYLLRNRSTGADGELTYMLQATQQGIPLYGSYVWLTKKTDSDHFDVRQSTSALATMPEVDTAPSIKDTQAIAALKSSLTRKLGTEILPGTAYGDVPKPKASLVFYPWKGHIYLAYEVALSFTLPVVGDWVGYVDAHTGKVLDQYNRLSEAQATPPIGYGKGRSGELRSFYISSEKEAGKAVYRMIDATRPTLIKTFDFRNPSKRSDRPEGYEYISSTSKTFSDAAAVDAHTNAKRVYLFYKNHYGRNSIDNKNMDILSFVHVNNSAQAKNNAYWSGWAMFYGDGTGLQKGGLNCTSCAFDLVAHELTHGVTQYTVNLEYRNQSGALSEAISDIMAAVMDADDWEIGEDTGAAVRSLADPGKYGQPSTMSDYVNLPADDRHDNGGVHANSGIPAHAGYLIALKIDNADIGLGGRDMLGRLTYAMLRDGLISSTADFAEAREGYITAVSHLSGLTPSQRDTIVDKVKEAWHAVGVGD